jgi:hypothetical protein
MPEGVAGCHLRRHAVQHGEFRRSSVLNWPALETWSGSIWGCGSAMFGKVGAWLATALRTVAEQCGLVAPRLRHKGVRRGAARRSERPLFGSRSEDEPRPSTVSPPIDWVRAKSPRGVIDLDASPIIAAMERRALRQIFDRLKLPLVPGMAFAALEKTRDPVAAFKHFATWVGVDPFAARDRNGAALSRMTLAIELLTELTALRNLLTEEGESRILDVLADTSGRDPLSRLRNNMEHVTSAAELHQIGVRLEELRKRGVASRMEASISKLIGDVMGDPLETPKEQIEEGIVVGRRLETALELLAALADDASRDLDWLQRNGNLSEEDGSWCDTQAETFESLVRRIGEALKVDEVERLIQQCKTIRDSLAYVRELVGGGRTRSTEKTPIEKFYAALDVLDLSRGPKLTWQQIYGRITHLRKQHHPDYPENRRTPEEKRRNTERVAQINAVKRDLAWLRREHGDKLVDVIV